MNEVQKATDMALAGIKKDLESAGRIVFDGLLAEPPHSRIPESVFVNYFLPCFLGKVENKSWGIEWIGIAGSPTARVDVINPVTNQILFTVPGLLSTQSLGTTNVSGGLFNVVKHYQSMSISRPKEADEFLNEALNDKYQSMNPDPNHSDIKIWFDILKHYGIITEEEEVKASDSQLDNFFDYK